MIKCFLLNKVKVKVTIDDIRLKSKITTNKTIKFFGKSFFHTIFGFTQSHLGSLGDIDRFIQRIPGTFKCDKPIIITGIDKFSLKFNCINGILVNGARGPVLYCFALDQPPGHKIYKGPRIKLSKKKQTCFISYQVLYWR